MNWMVRSRSLFSVAWLQITLAFFAPPAILANGDLRPAANAETIVLRDEKLQKVREQIIESVNEGSTTSISIAVAQNGTILWQEAFGWADPASKRRATPSTTYPIASISKPFTATGLMVLAEKGLVDLNQPANHYLKSAKITGHAADAQLATLRLILQHRAGLAEQNRFYFEGNSAKRPALDETITRYAIIVRQPDEQHDYSNLGYGVIERVIEEVSQRTFAEFMRRDVFSPLGLQQTSVGPNPETAAKLFGPKGVMLPRYDLDARGAGTLHSTAHDVVRFGMFHLKERLPDQQPILSHAGIDRMVSDHESSGSATGFWGLDWFYGLGWGGRKESEFGHLWYGHEGGSPGVSSILRIAPKQRIVVAVLSNSRQDLTYSLADSVLDAMIEDYPERRRRDPTRINKPPALTYKPPEELLGNWSGEIVTWSGKIPLTLNFGKSDARLKIGNEPDVPLTSLAFSDGRVSGYSDASIKNPDTSKAEHGTRFRLWFRNGKLTGEIAAASPPPMYPLWLPFWVTLAKN